MDKVIKNKRGLEPASVALQVTKQVQENFFIRYILCDQVWRCNINQFLSYSKNYICQFMQVSSWHHKLFLFHLSFWIWKVERKEKKLQKFEYLGNEKSFLDETKNIFQHLVKKQKFKYDITRLHYSINL